MASQEPADVNGTLEPIEDENFGPLPISKMEVRTTTAHSTGIWHIRFRL